jgi:tRNA G18 (ribose-2'-O)-methylase SpoU
MPVIRVDSLDDPRLEHYRNIRESELLRRRGLFVAEGRLVVTRLLESPFRTVSLLLNDASLLSLKDRLSRIPDCVPVFVCSRQDLTSIIGFNLHRGCLALAERPAECGWREISQHADLVLVLEGVADADNIGSIFRNTAAFGADGVLLSPACCDPLYRKAVRTSMGSVLRIPFARLENWPADLAALKSQGFMLVALTPRHDALNLTSFEPTGGRAKIALLVGSEGSGLTTEAEATADVAIRIPITPYVDSLNVATATGIALYSLTNQIATRKSAGPIPNPHSRIPDPNS